MTTYNIGPGQTYETFTALVAAQTLTSDDVVDGGGNTFRETWTIDGSGTSGHPVIIRNATIYGSTQLSTWTQEDYAPSTTPTRVQSTVQGSDSDASVTASYTNTPTQGNLLIAVGRSGGQLIANASISGWTRATDAQIVLTGSSVGIWYKIAGASESKDVTLDWTSSTQTSLKIEEWTNINATPLDQVAYTNDSGSTVTSRSSGTTGSTTVDNELLIAVVAAGSTFTNSSWSNSFTAEDISADWAFASKVVSSTGAQETTMSWTTARKAGGCIATFKASTSSSRTLAKASLAADPLSVWFVGTDGVIRWGEKQTSKDNLTSEFDWWFDDPNNLLYVFAATDPDTRYSRIETPTRDCCIYASGKNYITVQNITAAYSQTVDTEGYGVIYFNDSVGNIVENCTIHHSGVLSADPSGNGVFFQNCNAPIIRNNTISYIGRRGVVIFHNVNDKTVDNALIERNTIFNCYHSNIDVFRSGDVTGSSDGAIVRYNYIYNDNNYGQGFATVLATHGILIAGSSGASDYRVTNASIYYNVIKDIYQDQAIQIGRKVAGAIISNNIGYGCFTGSTTGVGIQVAGSVLNTDIVVKNNIMMDYKSYCFYIPELANALSVDNNLWYQSSGGTEVYVSANSAQYHYDDFAAYKAATEFDTNSKWQDPKFISTTNFRLQPNSPAIDAGTPVAGIHDQAGNADYAGAKSPQRTNPSIGAYEYIRKNVGRRIMPGITP